MRTGDLVQRGAPPIETTVETPDGMTSSHLLWATETAEARNQIKTTFTPTVARVCPTCTGNMVVYVAQEWGSCELQANNLPPSIPKIYICLSPAYRHGRSDSWPGRPVWTVVGENHVMVVVVAVGVAEGWRQEALFLVTTTSIRPILVRSSHCVKSSVPRELQSVVEGPHENELRTQAGPRKGGWARGSTVHHPPAA